MEKINYLPLGSVVIVEGGVRKYVIVARGLQLSVNGENVFFDYGACMYPMGMIGDQLMYFQHSDIKKVVFEGYNDEENELMIENIEKAAEKMQIKRGNVQAIKERMENKNE